MRQRTDFSHLGCGEREVEDRAILQQVLGPAGARDDHDALLHQPAQRDLGGALAVRRADGGEHRVVPGAAPRNRTVSDDRHALGMAGGGHFRLVEKGMHLDLVADQRLACKPQRLFDERNREVGNADVAGEPALLDLAQRAQRFGKRNLRVRPVEQQEVDRRQPQPPQAALGGTFQLVGREMRGPYLGGDENLVARDTRGPQPLAHLTLVVVHFRGIDVPVSKPQRLSDDARTSTAAQLPGTQTYERNARAFCLDDVHHGSRGA